MQGKLRFQGEVEFNSSMDNFGVSLFSRHNAGGAVNNRYGGMHVNFGRDYVKCKEEPYHNVHVSIGQKNLPKQFPTDKFVAYRVDVELDLSKKHFTIEAFLDYDLSGNFVNVATWEYTSKSGGLELPELYGWFRTNGGAFEVKVRNEKYIKLS